MNKLVVTAAIILHVVVLGKTASVPAPTSTMLTVLLGLEGYKEYKCPYLRKLLLDTTQFDFLNDCPNPANIKANSDMLCVLFYNNFLKLCNYSSTLQFSVKALLNDSTVKASLGKPDIEFVCGNLKTAEPVNQTLNKSLASITRFMNSSCAVMCVNFEDNVAFPICTLSALMNSIIKQVSNSIERAAAASKPDQNLKRQPDTQADPAKKPDHPQQIQKSKIDAANSTVVKILQSRPAPPENKADANTEDVEEEGGAKGKAAVAPEKPVKDAPPKDVPPPKDAPEHVPPPKDAQEDVPPPEVEAKDKNPADVPPAEGKSENQDENVNDKPDVAPDSQENVFELDDDMAIPKNEEEAPEPVKKETKAKPKETNEEDVAPANVNGSGQIEEEDSFFFVYFMMVCAVFILGYIGYHNKQKVLALVIEGRRGKRTSRRGGRPNSANYHKLDSNLEEAVTSAVHKNATNIIY